MLLSLIPAALGALAVPPTTPAELQLAPSGEPGGYNTPWTDVAPPVRFMRDATVRVEFVRDVAARCHATPPAGMQVEACYFPDSGLMVLPQPCPAPTYNRFAWTACHEIGHANGWGHDHEE